MCTMYICPHAWACNTNNLSQLYIIWTIFLFTSTSSNRYTFCMLKDNNDHTQLWYHSFTMKFCYKLWKVQLKVGKLQKRELGKENATHPTPCISNICPRLLPRSSTTDPMCSSGTSTVAICNQSIFSNKFFLKSG